MVGEPGASSSLRSEDWTAVWLGAALILLVLVGVRPATPTFSVWTLLAATALFGGAIFAGPDL